MKGETFEKYSILVNFKEGENFNHPDEIIYRDRRPYIEYFEDIAKASLRAKC